MKLKIACWKENAKEKEKLSKEEELGKKNEDERLLQ